MEVDEQNIVRDREYREMLKVSHLQASTLLLIPLYCQGVEQKCTEFLMDWQRKAQTELETKDCLIQDMEKYFDILFYTNVIKFLI